MRSLVAIVQTSLDGFVAGPNSEFDNFVGGEENLEFICSVTDTADDVMLGRITYELLESDWPTAGNKPGATENVIKYSNWYNAASKIVFSRTLTADNSRDIFILDQIHSPDIDKIKQQQGKDILLFGSPSIVHELLNIQVIDSLWLIVHPVLFGDGIPLFRRRNHLDKLSLVTSHQLTNGTLCNNYKFMQ